MSTLFIGLDAGGTGTRAIAATASGEIIGRGAAEGANAWSSGTSPATVISSAVREALGAHAASSVAGGVIAVAGGVSSVPAKAAAVVRAWYDLGITVEPRLVPDVVAAYAAGTTRPRGVVLAAGTGAVAASIDDGQLVRRAGGRGWLVGDEGSAVWLGVEGARAALLALDARGPATSLVAAVSDALEVSRADVATGITDAVYSGSPAELGHLAPVVVAAAEAGDAVAGSLLETAVEHLVDTLVAAAGDASPAVIVLAGSLLTRVPAVGEPVRASLRQRWPAAELAESVSGEAGATALAIRWHAGVPVSIAVLDRLRG